MTSAYPYFARFGTLVVFWHAYLTHSRGQARAFLVGCNQRLSSALNLSIHLHLLFIDGIDVDHPNGEA